MKKRNAQSPANPLPTGPFASPRHEVPGCPTGLCEGPGVDAVDVHGPLGVEKLEGRQESGRDEQDEAEEDEPEPARDSHD
jgi:hypothetical protein